MSYIHQALKKAQTERDGRRHKYEGILLSRSDRFGTRRKWLLAGIAGAVILLLAFVSYSWLDSGGARRGHAPEQSVKQSKPVAAVSRRTLDAEALYRVAKTHHKNGRLDQAKLFYEKALRVDPGSVASLNNLGVILMSEGDYAGARSRFEKAIRLKPDYVDPCYNLACLFALTDAPREGLNYLKRAISLNPQVKVWARQDADLEKLRNQPGFADIVG